MKLPEILILLWLLISAFFEVTGKNFGFVVWDASPVGEILAYPDDDAARQFNEMLALPPVSPPFFTAKSVAL